MCSTNFLASGCLHKAKENISIASTRLATAERLCEGNPFEWRCETRLGCHAYKLREQLCEDKFLRKNMRNAPGLPRMQVPRANVRGRAFRKGAPRHEHRRCHPNYTLFMDKEPHEPVSYTHLTLPTIA